MVRLLPADLQQQLVYQRKHAAHRGLEAKISRASIIWHMHQGTYGHIPEMHVVQEALSLVEQRVTVQHAVYTCGTWLRIWDYGRPKGSKPLATNSQTWVTADQLR